MLTKGKLKALFLGLRTKNLARALDLSEPYVTNILAGQVRPSKMVLKRLGELLGLPPEEIQKPAEEEQ